MPIFSSSNLIKGGVGLNEILVHFFPSPPFLPFPSISIFFSHAFSTSPPPHMWCMGFGCWNPLELMGIPSMNFFFFFPPLPFSLPLCSCLAPCLLTASTVRMHQGYTISQTSTEDLLPFLPSPLLFTFSQHFLILSMLSISSMIILAAKWACFTWRGKFSPPSFPFFFSSFFSQHCRRDCI